MRYLLIITFLFSSQLFAEAYKTDEKCDHDILSLKVNEVLGYEVNFIRGACNQILAEVNNLPFKVKLWYSTDLNIAQIEYKDYNKKHLELVCNLFINLDEITINADEYYCTK
jgi:hypothetical protein